MEISTYFCLPNSRTRVISIYQRSFASVLRGVIPPRKWSSIQFRTTGTSQNYVGFVVVVVLSDFWLMNFACRNPVAL